MLTFPRQTLGISLLCELSAHIAASRRGSQAAAPRGTWWPWGSLVSCTTAVVVLLGPGWRKGVSGKGGSLAPPPWVGPSLPALPLTSSPTGSQHPQGPFHLHPSDSSIPRAVGVPWAAAVGAGLRLHCWAGAGGAGAGTGMWDP